jgi:hypothetical protein
VPEQQVYPRQRKIKRAESKTRDQGPKWSVRLQVSASRERFPYRAARPPMTANTDMVMR